MLSVRIGEIGIYEFFTITISVRSDLRSNQWLHKMDLGPDKKFKKKKKI